jgi:hypothetical protein
MIVRIPTLLRSYTAGAAAVAIDCDDAARTLGDVLQELDRRFPGLRFRIVDEQSRMRPHIRIFVDAEPVRDLARRVANGSDVMIVGALSGG